MREREELIAENRRLQAEVQRLGALLSSAARMLRLAAAIARCRTFRGAFIRAAVEVERAYAQRPPRRAPAAPDRSQPAGRTPADLRSTHGPLARHGRARPRIRAVAALSLSLFPAPMAHHQEPTHEPS